ncbi:hypothetical protein [Alteraurantiacibacter palmitatis]|uniref:DUF3168 domain-containing protein n=1 Tax=Alteraurantiacibacter palmitatis TaxID=2054628 RepID=A0ABV7E6J5_9SPHN
MKAEFLAKLRSDAAVSAVAGSIAVGQGFRPAIDWVARRSDDASAFPAATLQVISGEGDYDQDGRTRFEEPRIRVTSFGASYQDARDLHDALQLVIETPGEVNGVRFHRAKLVLERDLPPEKLNDRLNIYRVAADYRVPATLGD